MVQCMYHTKRGAHYDKQFKLDAVQYSHEHRDLGL